MSSLRCGVIALALLNVAMLLGCQGPDVHLWGVNGPVVVSSGVGLFDPATGEVTFTDAPAVDALLDGSNLLPNASARNCEPATFNSGTLVLSVNARIYNGSTNVRYLAPIEMRLTGIREAGLVDAVNTDLPGAACGGNGLLLSRDDHNSNGVFDCISPDDTANTADDPGWDYSLGLGSDNALAPGESSGCRFIHFNLKRSAAFAFYFQILGVTDDGWPPAPSIAAVTTPTRTSSQTVSGRCVTTLTAPDVLAPDPSQLPAVNEITVLGGASVVTTPCQDSASCQAVGGVTYCGQYSVAVPLTANASNHLEVYQTLDNADRSPSAYATIVHDTTPPTIVSSVPAAGAIGVEPTVTPLITFSEALDATTVNSSSASTASIDLRRAGTTTRLGASVTLAANGVDATLVPTSNLLSNTTYEIVVTTGVRDIAGNAFAGPVTRAFTTTKYQDNVDPVVLTTDPTNGAFGVTRRTSITMVFSEPIADLPSTSPTSPSCVDSGSVTCTAITVRDSTRGVNVPGRRTRSADGATVTFLVNDPAFDSTGPDPTSGVGCITNHPPTADADFDCNRRYDLTVQTTLTDVAGNHLAQVYRASFTTAVDPDTKAPTITSFFPPPGSTGVAEGVTPQVLFSEPMAASSLSGGTIMLKEDGVVAVAGAVTLSSDGLLAAFQPQSTLTLGLRYVLFVNNTATDRAGNPLSAPSNSAFTVRAAPDTTPPAVLLVAPADDAANVNVNTNVRVVFSETIDPVTLNDASFTLWRYKSDGVTMDAAVPGQVSIAADGLSATFVPLAELGGNRLHEVTVTTAVRDVVGNALASTFKSTFKTIRTDSTPPCVTGIGPADQSTNVPANTHFAVVFSEPLLPSSVTASAFELRNASGTRLAITASLSDDGAQVLVIPQAALPAGAVTLKVTRLLEDNSAQTNPLDQTSTAAGCIPSFGIVEPTYSFTVASTSDTTPPAVVSIVPANNSTGVSLAADIVITFSEPIDPLSVNDTNLGLLVNQNGSRVYLARRYSPDNTVITLDPAPLLDSLTVYRASVAAGGIRDLAGNAVATAREVLFTTGDGSADVTPPTLTVLCPADNATNVNRQLQLSCNTAYPGRVVITFSEPLNADTVTTGNFRLLEATTPPVDRTAEVVLLPDRTTVLLTPLFRNGSLKNRTTHQVRISTAVTDTAGNPLARVNRCGDSGADDCSDFVTGP